MDLTKSITTGNEAVVAKEQHDPVPLHGSGVAAGGFPVDFEVFVLNNEGRWRGFSKDVFLGMVTKYVIYAPFVVRSNGLYYCGNDSTYKMLVEKGGARRWLHDLIIDSMKDVPKNWLNRPIKELVAI